IYQRTKDAGLEGPYILSDRRYKDSRILFYRYGGFKSMQLLQIDGTKQAVIVSPEGEHVPDDRLPYFVLPKWVKVPFDDGPNAANRGTTVLNDRYIIDGVLGFSNTGGVYSGTDSKTGQAIVIKEARPYTAFWAHGLLLVDGVALLEREYRVLRRLSGTGVVPKPIDLFVEWEHTFLVEERINAPTYQQYWASEQHLFGPYIRNTVKVGAFIPKFQDLAQSLLDCVERVHKSGVVLGDLSHYNVLVDPETLHTWLIDFESALIVDDNDEFESFSKRWVTPGFGRSDRLEGAALTYADDYYALGMLLYGAIAPIQPLFNLNPAARDMILDRFVEMGLPVEVKEVIHGLWRGEIQEVRRILSRWKDSLHEIKDPEKEGLTVSGLLVNA
ncbi:MAG: hypothetical protein M3P51_07800, partial [Chloroflexota bacterium]|nr:hypothetical protein [Chloroflexota bacterium]